MNVTWILEPDMMTSYRHQLVEEIESQGHVVQIVPKFYTSLDWGDTNRYYNDFAPEGSCVVCHASFQLTSLVAEDEVWVPGTYAISDAVDCSNYFPHFADCLLNSDYELLSSEDLASQRERLARSFGLDDRVFIRPDSGGKAFTGRLFKNSELAPDKLRSSGIPPHCLLVISRPKAILREWRFIIADHNVIAASMYKESGNIQMSTHIPNAAMDFARNVASREFQPDRVWVLDICETDKGEMRVVEINGFSSSNWYSCNLRDIVSAVSRIALDDWKLST